MGGPQFELRIAVGAQPGEIVVAAGEQIDPGERLSVAAIETLGQPHNRGEHSNRRAQTACEVAVSLVRFFRRRLAMVSSDQRDDLNFLGIEAP